MTPLSDSTDKVRRFVMLFQRDNNVETVPVNAVLAIDHDEAMAALQADRDQCFKDACELRQLAVETVALFSALQARYDALRKAGDKYYFLAADADRCAQLISDTYADWDTEEKWESALSDAIECQFKLGA